MTTAVGAHAREQCSWAVAFRTFLLATQCGDVARVRQLLPVTSQDARNAGLRIAARNDHVGAVQCLLAAGAQVRPSGNTSCTEAAVCGGAMAAWDILVREVPPALRRCQLRLDTCRAIAKDDSLMVQHLLVAKADPTTNCFITTAVGGNCAGALHVLLQAKADVGDDTHVSSAVILDHFDVLRVLIAAHADVNAVASQSDACTPAMKAVIMHHGESLRILLEAKADMRIGYDRGDIVRAAAKNPSPEVLRVLVAAKADFNDEDCEGVLPMFAAVVRHCTVTVSMLAAVGADVNMRTSEGRLPLAAAVRRENLCMVETLLHAKADVGLTGRRGYTSIQNAQNQDCTRIVRLLWQHSQNMDAEDACQ